MAKYICPQCSKAFIYCKGCALTPDLYKEKGFCSKECYKASKNLVESAMEEITSVEIEESIIEDVQSVEEEVPMETLADDVSIEIPDIETTTVVEPTIKKETNAYKNKKNKYKYTSSY